MKRPELPAYQRVSAPGWVVEWNLPLEVVTQLYGGGPVARKVDRDTPVRVSSIRGQLRFWWRALFGGEYPKSEDLFARERELFGGVGSKPDDIVRSPVSLAITDFRATSIDHADVRLSDPTGYATWPAREVRGRAEWVPPAERWSAGVQFTLRVAVHGKAGGSRDAREVEAALRAWLLFGGVGGRTRRGCGSLGLDGEEARRQWLPESVEPGILGAWLAPAGAAKAGYPSLRGARLLSWSAAGSAQSAWVDALNRLRDFRQGVHPTKIDITDAGSHARQRPALGGGNAGRPGRSRWPEPDHVRYDAGSKNFDHRPLIAERPVSWPRGQFGMPILYRFQNKDRRGGFFPNRPPNPGTIAWYDGKDTHQRLGSPLIIKPVQLRDGQFASLALWLSRTLPERAETGILDGKAGPGKRLRLAAPMSAMPTNPLFLPLKGKTDVRAAFMDWLQAAAPGATGGTL